MPAMNKGLLTIAILLAVLFGGCGEGDSTTTDQSAQQPFAIDAPKPEIVYADKYLKFKPNGLFGSEPKPIFPDSPPPDDLALVDLVEGIGPLASEGDVVTIQYVGYLYDSKKKFDSSWDQGKPLTFKLGAGEVIDGWEEGLIGMEVSDRRELVIPPDLAYGSQRVGDIPPDSTLVFVVDLLDVKSQ